MLSLGCGKKNIPGGPYDSTPTPCPQLWLSVNVKDINPSGTPVPVDALTITAQSVGVLNTGTTNTDGTATLEVFGFGSHIITIPGATTSGFPADLTYTVNIVNTFTTYNIVRNSPTFSFGLEPGYNTTYTHLTTTVKYDIVYHTNTKKYCTLSLEGLSNTMVSFTLNPPFVENDGDKAYLTLITPKYFDAGGYGSKVTFSVKGTYTDTNYINIGYDELIQNWYFSPVITSTFAHNGGGDPQLDFNINLSQQSINAPIANLKVLAPDSKIMVKLPTDCCWQHANTSPFNVWWWYSYNGGSQSNTPLTYTYPMYKADLTGTFIYHIMGNSDWSCTSVTFQFFTDDGFYKEVTTQPCF
jgi:hypothetical protein